jgi:NitT/TauT family transport system ATP-binding protein
MKVEPLPQATVGQIIGLLEFLEDVRGKKDIPKLAQELQYDLDDLYPIIDAAETLRFVEVENGDIKLTSIGKEFLKGDVNKRKKLFKKQLKRLKVFREALKALKKQVDEHMDREFFVELFSTHLPEENAEELVHVLIDWGRFAELIGYNADSEEVYLDEER